MAKKLYINLGPLISSLSEDDEVEIVFKTATTGSKKDGIVFEPKTEPDEDEVVYHAVSHDASFGLDYGDLSGLPD